ncbi:MAG: DUF2259 domain-containing protein [Rhodothermales bacterium]|nr:DUF2259 domain-containing protein [Rhodothermales bacterium]
MKELWLTIVLLAILGTTVTCVSGEASRKGDAASIELLGFSGDGEYLAYETFGLIEGGPIFWSEIYFINVPENSWAAPPVKWYADNEQVSLGMVRTRVREQADSTMAALKIISDNVGRQYLYNMFTDSGADPHNATFYTGGKLTGQYFEEYRLSLEESVAGSCDDFGEKKMLRLSITNLASNQTAVLQDDKSVPESRGCTLSYRIQEVHIYQTYVIVLINKMTPGWEGRNMRFMCITGVLPRNDQ